MHHYLIIIDVDIQTIIFITRNLKEDPDCQNYLPLDPESHDLYTKCSDGILFW